MMELNKDAFSKGNDDEVHSISLNDRVVSIALMPCEKCHKETEWIQFTHLQFGDCKVCILKYLNSIMEKRIKNYIYEQFNNLEYYCRPVNILENQILYDEDFVILFGKTISQMFKQLLDNSCKSCSASSQGQIMRLKCGCQVCKSCLVKKLKTVTNDKIYLSPFEKKHLKSSQGEKCFCGGETPFDIDYAIEILANDIKMYKTKADERQAMQTKKFCLHCGTCVESNPYENKNEKKITCYGVITKDEMPVPHVMCLKCHEKNKDMQPDLFNCQICEVWHKIDTKLWSEKGANKNNDDCSGCCVIF